ncbi:MAG: LTA synthase family protein [Bacteroidales bacterium]|nr:LTA synthase family protein [Bacteroidales bacterium]
MKKRLIFLVKYLLLWLLFFEFSRIFFMLYNYPFLTKLSVKNILDAFVYGFQHDISMVGYVMEISSVILIIFLFIGNVVKIKRIFRGLTLFMLLPFSLLTVSDAELYRNWSYRTDCSVLQYLKLPKEALSSIPLWHLLLLLFVVILIVALFYLLYRFFVEKHLNTFDDIKKWNTVVFIVLMAVMIIPIRGGIGVAALRTGSVYFCSEPFANHAAINDHWHFLYSIGYSKREVADIFMDESECERLCASLMESKNEKPVQLINAERPNILLFILESFTESEILCLGGEDVAPNIDSIAKTGVLFSNCYGNGTKSEMGIVSILSGYPAQPTTAIIKYTEKSEKLPYLSKVFDSLGYNLSLYHGGDIRFGNMNSYFRNGRFEKCVTIDDFDKKEGNAKWGAYDHVVLNRLFSDLKQETEPFFSVCYTLSSHEPFDVPMKSEFYGDSQYEKFQNSVHYADSCLGDFMRKAKNESWWENTLVVFVSDHGARMSKEAKPVSKKEKFHIPMIWCGGVVEKDTVIQDLICQCDLPKMLCNQLNLCSKQFYFSKDILCGDKQFAFYAFNNGFGYMRGSQFVAWDNESSRIIDRSSDLQDTTVSQGKAFLQKVTTDFCEK